MRQKLFMFRISRYLKVKMFQIFSDEKQIFAKICLIVVITEILLQQRT